MPGTELIQEPIASSATVAGPINTSPAGLETASLLETVVVKSTALATVNQDDQGQAAAGEVIRTQDTVKETTQAVVEGIPSQEKEEEIDNNTSNNDTSEMASTDDTAPAVAHVDVDPVLADKVMTQLEFYFGDANLPRDKFLLETINADPQGWVPISTLLKFNRLKALCPSSTMINTIVAQSRSNMLQVKPDVIAARVDQLDVDGGYAIRRFTQLRPVRNRNERSVHVDGLPLDMEPSTMIDEVKSIFAPCYGRVEFVKIMRNPEKEFKGQAFVDFGHEREAYSVLSKTIEYKGNVLKLQPKSDFISQIRQEQRQQQQKQSELQLEPSTSNSEVQADACNLSSSTSFSCNADIQDNQEAINQHQQPPQQQQQQQYRFPQLAYLDSVFGQQRDRNYEQQQNYGRDRYSNSNSYNSFNNKGNRTRNDDYDDGYSFSSSSPAPPRDIVLIVEGLSPLTLAADIKEFFVKYGGVRHVAYQPSAPKASIVFSNTRSESKSAILSALEKDCVSEAPNGICQVGGMSVRAATSDEVKGVMDELDERQGSLKRKWERRRGEDSDDRRSGRRDFKRHDNRSSDRRRSVK